HQARRLMWLDRLNQARAEDGIEALHPRREQRRDPGEILRLAHFDAYRTGVGHHVAGDIVHETAQGVVVLAVQHRQVDYAAGGPGVDPWSALWLARARSSCRCRLFRLQAGSLTRGQQLLLAQLLLTFGFLSAGLLALSFGAIDLPATGVGDGVVKTAGQRWRMGHQAAGLGQG